MSELDAALDIAFAQVLERMRGDPEEALRRARRAAGSVHRRPISPWRLALRASDTRIGAHAHISDPELARLGCPHWALISSDSIPDLCRPVHVPWPGIDWTKAAARIGRSRSVVSRWMRRGLPSASASARTDCFLRPKASNESSRGVERWRRPQGGGDATPPEPGALEEAQPEGLPERYIAAMASTLTCNLLHITFSTKERRAIITPEMEPVVYPYIGGICRRMKSPLLTIGGTADHVHLLVSLAKTVALADLMMQVKRDSSKLMREKTRDFNWQDGYFAFSIGASGVERVRGYIATQKEHHARIDFKDEVRALLRKYGVAFDERYVWD